jgi:hypothetical protein
MDGMQGSGGSEQGARPVAVKTVARARPSVGSMRPTPDPAVHVAARSTISLHHGLACLVASEAGHLAAPWSPSCLTCAPARGPGWRRTPGAWLGGCKLAPPLPTGKRRGGKELGFEGDAGWVGI